MEVNSCARVCAEAAADKKASDIVALDMAAVSTFTEVFVIVSADSEPQLKAIASSIREQVWERLGRKPLAEDGLPVSQWMVMDYGDVIVHIFQKQMRERYCLEDLWSDAPRLELGLEEKR